MDALAARALIIDRLSTLGADLTDGEAETRQDGTVRRTLIIDVTSGVTTSYLRRMSGRATDTVRTINVLVVAPSRDSCLVLAEKTRDLLDGARIAEEPHGLLEDASYDMAPAPEPDTSPARWSRALAFQWATKRSH
jgi:hypothetical protein